MNPQAFRKTACERCGVALTVPEIWAAVPPDDLARDRRSVRWPDLPLRRLLVCEQCLDQDTTLATWAGLPGCGWRLVSPGIPDGFTLARCAVCGDKGPTRDPDRTCSQVCRDALARIAP
jgi:hypothetical protein